MAVALGLVVGNFLYQAFTDHNWMAAFDRSLFQAGAIAIYVLVNSLK